ncbi:MAG: hypothetical protein ACREJB_01310 [Planctomycetaceae bacterium]
MFVKILIGYCVGCWIISLALRWLLHPAFLKGYLNCPDDEEDLSPERWQRAWLITFPLAPLLMPVVLLVVLRCFLWEVPVLMFRQFRLDRQYRIYKEYTFTPVNYFHLDAGTREFFDRSTPALFSLGFRLLGDYQLKDQPISVIDRLYWRDDGTVLADASVAEGAFARVEAIGFQSFLADGVCVETQAIEDPDPESPPDVDIDRLHLTCEPELPAEKLYALHLNELTTLARARKTKVLMFDDEQFGSLIVYNQRLHRQWRYRIGESTPPPAPVLPPPLVGLPPNDVLLTLPATRPEDMPAEARSGTAPQAAGQR